MPDAVEDLVLRYHPLIRKWANYAGQRLTSSEDEEVLAQVRFLFLSLVWEFDPERKVPFLANVSAKLPPRVRHWIRRERAHLLRQVRLQAAEDENPCAEQWLADLESDESFEKALLRAWLSQTLQALPRNQRRVMTLTFEGFTEREIASRLGLSGPGVHKLKKTALARLQEYWEEPPQNSAA